MALWDIHGRKVSSGPKELRIVSKTDAQCTVFNVNDTLLITALLLDLAQILCSINNNSLFSPIVIAFRCISTCFRWNKISSCENGICNHR